MNLGGCTSQGPREANEDSFYVRDFSDIHTISGGIVSFALVSDGMGGYQGGDVASGITVGCAKRYIDQVVEMAQGNRIELDANAALAEMARNAHESILAEARKCGKTSMGATFVGAFVGLTHAWIGHIGDSRAYLIRDGVAKQLTEDHSHVGRLLSRGIITEQEAQNHPDRNRIERALGFSDGDPEYTEVDLEPGDVIVLCTDGVYTVIDAPHLADCVRKAKNADDAAQRIVKKALSRGTDDNSTAVVITDGKSSVGAGKTERIVRAETQQLGGTPGVAQTQLMDPVEASATPVVAPRKSYAATVVPLLIMLVCVGSIAGFFFTTGVVKGDSGEVAQSVAADFAPEPDESDATDAADAKVHDGDGPSKQKEENKQPPATVNGPAESQHTDTSETQHKQDDASASSDTTVVTQGTGAGDAAVSNSSTSSFTVGDEATLKFVDLNGQTQLFDGSPFFLEGSALLSKGVSVTASTTTDSYQRPGRTYRMLSDAYLNDLRNDIRSCRDTGQTEFTSDLSKLADADQYRQLVSGLASNYGEDDLDNSIAHLVVDADGLAEMTADTVQPTTTGGNE